MGTEGLLSNSTLLGFFLTMVRVSAVFVFVPIPGMKGIVDPARITLTLGITLALYSLWPHPSNDVSAGLLVTWVMAEAALGVGIGLAVAFAIEAFLVGAQLIGMQAGYSFASTIDPATQADSTVLVSFAQTCATILFFSLGLDREVLRIFARSMVVFPPGTFTLSRNAAVQMVAAGSTMFSTGLRLALPVIAVMVMVDLSLALLGRVNAQLQLITIAFPVKMLVGLGLLAWLTPLLPALLRGGGAVSFQAARSLITH